MRNASESGNTYLVDDLIQSLLAKHPDNPKQVISLAMDELDQVFDESEWLYRALQCISHAHVIIHAWQCPVLWTTHHIVSCACQTCLTSHLAHHP